MIGRNSQHTITQMMGKANLSSCLQTRGTGQIIRKMEKQLFIICFPLEVLQSCKNVGKTIKMIQERK